LAGLASQRPDRRVLALGFALRATRDSPLRSEANGIAASASWTAS